eukprot:scaffold12333_cov24-Phaeocystis_antarctica.AAC.1
MTVGMSCASYGGMFIGKHAAEVTATPSNSVPPLHSLTHTHTHSHTLDCFTKVPSQPLTAPHSPSQPLTTPYNPLHPLAPPQVLGDYGAGPNHVLPTAGTGKYTGGLSVHTFLRQRTWMRIDDIEAAQQQ